MSDFKSWLAYWDFQHAVHRNARFVRSPAVEEFLTAVRKTGQTRSDTITNGSYLWRAQLGNDWRTVEDPDGGGGWEEELPYPPERMKPFRDRAREGRANPKGIPCLYLATAKQTALAEVRPWLGSKVSIAIFKTLRELKVLDCSAADRNTNVFFGNGPPQEREGCVWNHINNAFARPVSPTDDVAEYVGTQIIAELFKADGFDGIVYQSSLSTEGLNVALFDVNAAELVNCGLSELQSLRFEFKDTGNPYSLAPIEIEDEPSPETESGSSN